MKARGLSSDTHIQANTKKKPDKQTLVDYRKGAHTRVVVVYSQQSIKMH